MNFSNLSRLEISAPFATTSFFLSIALLGCEHATKLKRNKHIKPVLFPIVILSYTNYWYTRKKLLSSMKVAFLSLSPSSEKSHMKMK